MVRQFLSTLSLRRATIDYHGVPLAPGYFYPRSPCGERLADNGDRAYGAVISIHALLAESDLVGLALVGVRRLFLSTLSLRRATGCQLSWGTMIEFLSTLSLRRATYPAKPPHFPRCHFYPRSPCGERQGQHAGGRRKPDISIHALLAESDAYALARACIDDISIHALLAESD